MTTSLARRLWYAIEPLHAVVYFDQRPTDALKDLGLRGFWMSYFAGRFAPLGPLGPEPAAAMAYGFAPAMVARALPDAWRYARPDRIVAARLASATTVLSDVPTPIRADVAELVSLLVTAAAACRYEGRPIAAGWLAIAPPSDDLGQLWLYATVLREHRGDGHVNAAVAAGLRGLDATLTHVATGAMTRSIIQPSRGWSDHEWDQSLHRLQARGLLDRDARLTRTGGALRTEIEATTDRLAAGPVERLGQTGVERVIELATPISRHLIDTGVVPVPNPIGVPRP
jgi:hypothetical protein